MCGRYSLVCIDDLGNRFRVFNPMIGARSRFNIPPGNEMPAIVKREDEERWLSGESFTALHLNEILAPYPPGEMVMFPVSPLVNNPAMDDERMITPLNSLDT